jgi:hypothetical protein
MNEFIIKAVKKIITHQTFWTAVSSIATFTVAFIALFQNRRRITVRIVSSSIYSQAKQARIVITNASNNSETITRIFFKDKKHKRYRELIQGFDLPKTLKAHEIVEWPVPCLTDKNSIRAISVEDSLGKRWECDKKSFKNTIKLLREHQGPGGLMGYKTS